ncbi:MAG TPA: heme o synthase, partial [bacterium]|nr:heme o synthase [bacterium]
RRAVAAGRVDPPSAFAFAVILGALAFAILASLVNLLSAILAMLGLLFYVFIYTVWLKRATPQNIVIGGAAGAVPPLVGWAAATGRVELPAMLLFLIVFLWTPPHFWALSLYRLDDYARAHVPMLPVVAGENETRRQIVIYSMLLVATTLVLYPVGSMGWMYASAAAALGGVFLWRAIHVRRAQTPQSARGLFSYSIVYLALLFAAMVMDRMLLT